MKKEPMEPMDIDKIIKNKLQESNDLHSHEIDSSKPFIWSAVQNNIRRRNLTWYHLAAAVVMLLIGFSFILFSIQNSHNNEIELLSGKIDQLQENYISQAEHLYSKEIQTASLGDELKSLELKLTEMQLQKPTSQKETFVYRTDTVYVKQIEYINTISDPVEMNIITTGNEADPDALIKIAQIKVQETDDEIFPSYTRQNDRKQSESRRFKFQSFASGKN
jgi:hypothetical protein